MKSAPPPDSASFDALWDVDESADEGLPPALAPRLQGTVLPQEDRATLAPPVPAPDYVQSMMELGELDDPMTLGETSRPPPQAMHLPPLAVPRLAPPSPPAALGLAQPSLGLVLASERELLLDEPPRLEPRAPSPGGGGPRRRSTGKFPAIQPRAESPGHYTPSPFAPPPRPAMAMGARAVGAAHALPVPRAPSVPPAAEPELEVQSANAFDALDALDDLGSLDDILQSTSGNTPPGPPVKLEIPRPAPPRPAGTPRPPAPRAAPTEPRRYTPPALSVPAASSKPNPSAPSSPRRAPGGGGGVPVSAGLRLGRRAQTPVSTAAVDDRITPVPAGDSGPRPWSGAGELSPPSEPAPSSLPDRAREMAALFDAQNYSSALVLAESVLLSDPDHAQARRCAGACRERLTEKYLGNLGGRESIPRVTMSAEEIRWLSLDHRAGFLLSFIDGSMSIEEVLDVSSMPELDALRIMFELRMQGVIEIVEPSRRPGRR